ncbi:MAG: hypothetical protein Q8O94_03095 [bacterium]|nr:hypothetical protein [bacterium]
MKLKIEIEIARNGESFRIIEQDESLRGGGELFIATNEVRIRSYHSPEWYSYYRGTRVVFYIRGNKRNRDRDSIPIKLDEINLLIDTVNEFNGCEGGVIFENEKINTQDNKKTYYFICFDNGEIATYPCEGDSFVAVDDLEEGIGWYKFQTFEEANKFLLANEMAFFKYGRYEIMKSAWLTDDVEDDVVEVIDEAAKEMLSKIYHLLSDQYKKLGIDNEPTFKIEGEYGWLGTEGQDDIQSEMTKAIMAVLRKYDMWDCRING